MRWLVGSKPKKKTKPKKSKPAASGQGAQSGSADTLASSVRTHGQALVLLQEPPAALRAKMVVMSGQSVTLQMYDIPDVEPGAGQVCCVQYHHEAGSSVFLVPVVHYDTDRDGAYLTVQRPAETLGLDARRAFRIPIETGQLRVVVHGEGLPDIDGEVADVSRHGALVVSAEDPTAIPVGTPVVLELIRQVDPEQVEVLRTEARVVRHHELGWGVAFAQPATSMGNEALADLVSSFERDLLRKQRQTEATFQPLPRET